MLRIGASLLNGSFRKKAPTLTIHAESGVARDIKTLSEKAVPPRILRPLSAEEENYELTRAKRNAGSNLRMKGKLSIQTNRKSSQRRLHSYDNNI